MTHIAGNQMRSLSVRTRAFTHKNHECLARRRRFLKNNFTALRLRSRDLAPSSTAKTTLSVADRESPLLTDSIYPNHPQTRNHPVASATHEIPYSHDVDNQSQSTISSYSSPFCLSSSSHSSCASFPSAVATSSTSSMSSDTVRRGSQSMCMWENCDNRQVGDPSDLITHLQQAHVLPQVITGRRKCFTCRWHGCRVYGQPSVSAAWLEQHILLHTEARGKPFRCIFDACQLRFSTATLLERHIQMNHLCRWESHNSTVAIAAEEEDRVSSMAEMNKLNTGGDLESDISNVLDSQQSASPIANCTALSQFPLVGNSRRLVKRRQKPRGYRVRRIDFYDKRTCMVIENRLKLMRIFGYGGEPLTYRLQSQHELTSASGRSISPLVHRCASSSRAAGEWTNRFTESTLRAFRRPPSPCISVNRLSTPRSGVHYPTPPLSQSPTDSGEVKRVQSSNLRASELERFRRIALLLTVPHTFVGQRVSENLRTELLVRWTGESKNDQILPTWVFEDDLRAAVAMVAV